MMTDGPGKGKLKARIDLAKAKIVDDVSLGEVVKVTLVGRVVEMRGPSQELISSYVSVKGNKKKEEEYNSPGTLCVEFTELNVKSQKDFEDPEEDD